MADGLGGPTRYGETPSLLQSLLGAKQDIWANRLATRSPFQEGAQLGTLPLTLARLAGGFKAPSIQPAAREAQRQFREQTVPDLMEQFAGGGSRGALLRGIQGAGSDLQSKLGALQMQQQFELQKQRQEQLPRLLEMGIQPSFQTALTDMPIRPDYTVDPKTGERQYSQTAQLPLEEQYWRTLPGQRLSRELQGASGDISGLAQQGIRGGRQLGRAVGVVGSDIARGIQQAPGAIKQGAQRAAEGIGRLSDETARLVDRYGIQNAIAAARRMGGPRGEQRMRELTNYVAGLVRQGREGIARGAYGVGRGIESAARGVGEYGRSIEQRSRVRQFPLQLQNRMVDRGVTLNPRLLSEMKPRHNQIIRRVLSHSRPQFIQALNSVRSIPELEKLGRIAGRRASDKTLKSFIKKTKGK